MTDLDLNQENINRLLSIIDVGLTSGLGTQQPGEMCVEAAVCYWLGLPHSDNPSCVGSAVRAFKVRLNDADWSSSQARASGLRRLAIAQLGSDPIDQGEFTGRLILKTIQVILPKILRPSSLEINAVECEQALTLSAAADAARAADAAARAAADTADTAAADAADADDITAAHAADAAVDTAARAADTAARAADTAAHAADTTTHAADTAARAAADAARAADAAADTAAADAADADAARDEILSISAELAVTVLGELSSPGYVWIPALTL